jgi:hypothetical protein
MGRRTGCHVVMASVSPVIMRIGCNPEWVFPCENLDLLDLQDDDGFCHYVYNLVLESGHYVRIGNYDVVTLGHHFTDNAVIRHPYFGTNAVIEDLKTKDGWENGYITLDTEDQHRDAHGLVCGV